MDDYGLMWDIFFKLEDHDQDTLTNQAARLIAVIPDLSVADALSLLWKTGIFIAERGFIDDE